MKKTPFQLCPRLIAQAILPERAGKPQGPPVLPERQIACPVKRATRTTRAAGVVAEASGPARPPGAAYIKSPLGGPSADRSSQDRPDRLYSLNRHSLPPHTSHTSANRRPEAHRALQDARTH